MESITTPLNSFSSTLSNYSLHYLILVTKMLMQSILFLVTFCICAVHCRVLLSTGDQPSGDELPRPRIVSVLEELKEIGEHQLTACPFTVEEKKVKQDHPLGNVAVDTNEIVCSTSCQNKKLRSWSYLPSADDDSTRSITNPATGLPETIISTNVAVGCTCAPQDTGIPGEDV
uniref:Uncharacterized protein n=1 Tax=Daphnia galeata TaxID=27404 RepID=A0A8J2RM90_9CRUS|nr:unnamed protein product [Daphnia galeata]